MMFYGGSAIFVREKSDLKCLVKTVVKSITLLYPTIEYPAEAERGSLLNYLTPDVCNDNPCSILGHLHCYDMSKS